ncbi:MBL fold metallo-hydrolase [Nocardiopsis alborubida]|uniref:MBL fold metallo-hydrolase n=1 Tax=Nocardiopsis alborubida TaxID=146802 RepID=A0A7X6MJF4_9ACTN|nr:MBL fold metallo-hydrolase [Nocardiopsis alborubida]NKZ00889.1 MBL fold metallo-hydrolase [Nocardiopsis alborubida]
MIFTQYYLDCLSQASYLVADESTGKAVIIDPRIDVDEYLDDVRDRGLTVEGVINTHLHADFISGHFEIAERTGAWIGYGDTAETQFPIRRLAEGERISLGEVTLEIMHTPGHTPESISVLVYEKPDHTVPYGVLTGDALFIGDVGRPDLAASFGHTPDKLAPMLYDSVHNKLMALPDPTRLFPGHGAGSACGKNISTETQSTIGEQRRDNYACQPMSEEAFVELVREGQEAIPNYFSYDAARNRQQRDPVDIDALVRPLELDTFMVLRAQGAVVVDARDQQAFSAGHLRGALNIGTEGRFAETAGMMVEPGSSILVVTDPGRERETVTRLARVGLDDIAGFLPRPESAMAQVPQETVRAPRVSVGELNNALRDDRAAPVVVDVRGSAEREGGAIKGAVHIPLANLPERMEELATDRPVVVHCAGGYRSSVAASYLRARGFQEVSDLVGGYNAYQLASA